MDDRMIAATLAAAVLAKTEIPPGKSAAAVAVHTYQRLLRGVAKVHLGEEEKAPKPAAPVAAAKTIAGIKVWPPKK